MLITKQNISLGFDMNINIMLYPKLRMLNTWE